MLMERKEKVLVLMEGESAVMKGVLVLMEWGVGVDGRGCW